MALKRVLCTVLKVIIPLVIFLHGSVAEPSCTPPPGNTEVQETDPMNHLVYTLQCTGSGLSYAFTGKPSSYQDFTINNQGEIRLSKPILDVFTFKYSMMISVTEGSQSISVQLNVTKKTTNSFDPVFDFPAQISVSEAEPLGTFLTSCNVSDADVGALAKKTRVGIIKPHSAGAKRWIIDPSTCNFYVNTLLDYENKKSYTIGILAFDLDPVAPRTSTRSVNIQVVDVNDNSPTCSDYYKLIYIREDHSKIIPIYEPSCTDADSGVNKFVLFKMSDTNSALVQDKFQIDLNSGKITLKNTIDYEVSSFYEVNVDVYDGGSPSLTTSIIVAVVVSDVDDNKPEFESNPIQRDLKETTPIGTPLFPPISTTDKDAPNTFASTVTYGEEGLAIPEWVDIDSETGAIFVKSHMNWLTSPWISMNVSAYSSDQVNAKSLALVNITIIDENNVAPKFEKVFYQGIVKEDGQPGTSILTVKANDPENGLNGEVRYSISSTNFDIDEISGVISLKSMVDFEQNTVFSLNVEASDRGTPVQKGNTFILINVIPVNEHTPTLDGVPMADRVFEISENTEPGTILYNFTAIDMDAGFDGQVTYSVADIQKPFTIEPKTGSLRVGSTLDRETDPVWNITIIVRDNSETSPKSSSIDVTVIVTDYNDNRPICEPLSNTVLNLPHSINSVLATLKCTDKDIGLNSQFDYTIMSGNLDNSFTVEANGDIRLVKAPTQEEYRIFINVRNKGTPLMSTTVYLNVLAELKFNFSNLPAKVNIMENTVLAAELYDVDACCVFGFTKYELLSGNEDNHILLDPSSGKIILMNSFDRELKSDYVYRIKAVSSDNTVLESELSLEVTDANDITPSFQTNFHYLSVSEDYDVARSVITLTATDRDIGLNGEIVYDIETGNAGDTFKILQNGAIWLNRSLDAERTSEYALVVTATDKGNTSLTGSTSVFIQIINVNDFHPRILNINDGMVSTNVSEDAALGGPIFNIQVEDKDIDTVFTFTITQGNDDGMFVVDGSSGTIYLVRLLDRETVDQYNLTVEVKTSDKETVAALVSINVLDVNDRDPKFNSEAYDVKITDEDPIDTLILDFSNEITDADLGINKKIAKLEISEGDTNLFDTKSLSLVTKTKVNYNLGQFYFLTLKATDSGITPRYGYTRVSIQVLPKFRPPLFNPNQYTLSIPENAALNEIIFDANATSDGAVEGIGGSLSYRIRSGNPSNTFFINPSDGKILVAANLDYEKINEYFLLVDARSKEDKTLLASATVTISIGNINDNIPTFTNTIYNFTIDETISTGTSVGQVSANDLDNDAIQYSIANALGSSDFNIDVNTGEITVANNLDFLRHRSYNLPIVADDGGSRTGEARVVINVNDVNNHPPTFTSSPTASVSESVTMNTVFYTAVAEDKDTGINGQIKYSLDQPNPLFNINPDTGALSVTAALDRETVDRHNLVIRATDQASSGSLSGMLTLTVIVLDVNDNAPTFSAQTARVTVNRLDPAGTVVYVASANDADTGAKIDYGIISGNTDNLFLMNLDSGEIVATSGLNTVKDVYNLTLSASDRGPTTHTATMTLQVIILTPATNDTSDGQTMSISENLSISSVVGVISPRSDHDPSAVITFSKFSGDFNDYFSVDSGTGQVTTKSVLDREQYPFHRLIVRVRDNLGKDYTKAVSINVLDVNDNDPTISTLETNLQVVENTPAGQIVARFTVTDPDSGVNGESVLTLSDSPVIGKIYFEMDGNLLKIKQPIDYEVVRRVDLTVMATDGGVVPKSSSIDVTVTVIDVTDNVQGSSVDGSGASIYFSVETSARSTDGDFVVKLNPEDLKMNISTGSVEFSSINKEDVFSISPGGDVTVQKASLLEPENKYFFWFLAAVQNGGNITYNIGLMRIDTFDPILHLVSLESSLEVAALETFRNDLSTIVNNNVSPNVAKIWKIREYSSTYRRRLLADIRSQALVYVMLSPVPYDVADIQKKKEFQNSKDVQTVITAAMSQFPNASDIMAVNVFAAEPTQSATAQEPFTSSLDFMITLILLIIIILIIIVLLIIFYCYKKKKRQQRKIRNSRTNLVQSEADEEQERTISNLPPVLGTKKSKEGGTEMGGILPTAIPPISSTIREEPFVPVAPAEHRPPASPVPIQTSSPIPKEPIPSVPPVTSQYDRNLKPMNNAAALRLPTLTPVQSTTVDHENMTEVPENAHKPYKLKPIEKHVLPVPQLQDERHPSTIDLSVIGTEDGGPVNNTPIPRRHGPVVDHGKEYDGVGIDPNTQQRYAYNTRTGSTLWVSKDNNLATARQPLPSKKKATPLLQVGEARSDFTPLNLNRSVKMRSDSGADE